MIEYLCPICQSPCKLFDKSVIATNEIIDISSIFDVKCLNEKHMYLARIKNNKITKIKIRLDELYCKFYFEENFIEIWSRYVPLKRVRINSIFHPDFSDTPKLKKKIEQLLTFI